MLVCGSRNTAHETDSSTAVLLHCELSDEQFSNRDPNYLKIQHYAGSSSFPTLSLFFWLVYTISHGELKE